jgi:TolB-like protein
VICAALLVIGTVGALIAYLPGRPGAGSESPSEHLSATTVAVLPFRDASTEPGGELIAFGLAEGLLHRLASVGEIPVRKASGNAANKPC